jgi:hypothetical protein
MVRSTKKLQFDPPYDLVLGDILTFKSLSDAEGTIRKLEDLRQDYMAVGDLRGLEYCRQVALAGRNRAAMISRNQKIAAVKRIHKREVARWFQIWLESPELFASWLALRKKTQDYEGMVNSQEPDADNQSGQSGSSEFP